MSRSRGKRYSRDEIHEALKALVLNNGSVKEAARETGISQDTLIGWRRRKYRAEYQRLLGEYEESLAKEFSEDAANLARKRMDLLSEIGEEAYKALQAGDHATLSRLSGADKNFATTAGIFIDKNRQLRDKPTEIVEHRVKFDEIEAGLKELGVIEGTAEEIVGELES